MTQLTLDNLTKEYGLDGFSLRNLFLTIESGELLALLGPSGSGKTTTLRLIAGLMQTTKGDILFDGQSVLKTPPEKRGAVMVFQEHALFPFMSVGENIAFGLKVQTLVSANRTMQTNSTGSRKHSGKAQAAFQTKKKG